MTKIKNVFVVFFIIVLLFTPSCRACDTGWKTHYTNDVATQQYEEVSFNYLLLYPMFKYVTEHGVV
jgi:hypothetical protein|tara:strand:+ start:1859 stop:2056 length:198 start_codon:yes stop_codon:yes gene_type:complete